MGFILNPDRMCYADLSACVQNFDALWKQRVVPKIPHVNARLDFLLNAPMCRFLLIEYEYADGEEEPPEGEESLMQQIIDRIKIGLLILEMVGGLEYIREHLNGPHPSAFLTAVHDGFIGACAGITADDIDTTSNTTAYLSRYATAYATSIALIDDMFLDPDMLEDLPYPSQKVADQCSTILANLRLPDGLMEAVVPESIAIQLHTEIRCDRPTLN